MFRDKPKITALHHVQLAMPKGKEDAARHFYGTILGIPERKKPDNLAKRGGCWFENAAIRIHLGVEEDFRPARKAHPAIRVTGLAALKALFERKGIMTRSDEPLEGYNRFYVDDPFGNRIEFLEPL